MNNDNNGYILDNGKYFRGTEFLLKGVNKKLDWKTKEEIGTVLTVLSFDSYELFKVNLLGKKISELKELKDLKKGSIIEFDELEARLFVINGKVVISCRAKGFFVSFEKKAEDMFMSINEEYED